MVGIGRSGKRDKNCVSLENQRQKLKAVGGRRERAKQMESDRKYTQLESGFDCFVLDWLITSESRSSYALVSPVLVNAKKYN